MHQVIQHNQDTSEVSRQVFRSIFSVKEQKRYENRKNAAIQLGGLGRGIGIKAEYCEGRLRVNGKRLLMSILVYYSYT